ncbi:isoprenylcysteine carboxylmethyltransferase family protein [Leptospira langatensis]|uniref:Isoprenylcysteine carboxylmethyltransferase family protein n=1 Tax=Leptospira langatensis TaxID=2484983 RepID=A0A5F1ZYF4_9LEPT|nr:NnrU family protein [Leptospira langatensis]TGJ98366.1 isoprenylcysteine carboxylmethyltransferase family protein [Leptospira langatensis]TGL43280.1 isoprenylcysteine carboxylmethyltransferase family protein [Leptospira langatensis]
MGNILTRILHFIFALIAYMLFVLSMITFVLRLLDATQFMEAITYEFQIGLAGSICMNIALLALFGVPHSIMARSSFKKYSQQIMPMQIERSLYVLVAGISLIALSCLWQPIHFEIWNIKTNFGMYATYSIFLIGLLLAVASTFMIDHFDLFGLKQPWNSLIGSGSQPIEFVTPSLYKVVRHPMMLGILLMLWSTPLMNAGHLLLSLGMTLYIVIGTWFEERDLVRNFGEKYLQYKRTVPMLLPSLKQKERTAKDPIGGKI